MERFGEQPPCRAHRRRNCLDRGCAQRRRSERDAARTPGPPDDSYPTCSTCGHHGSGILAGQCSAFVPYPEPGVLAGYCNCRCVEDPAVKGWLENVR